MQKKNKNLLGLIGNPVEHSKSPELFRNFFERENLDNWDYKLFRLNHEGDLMNLVKKQPELCGINVTIPFKKRIISVLNTLSPEARETGAVNTIIIQKKDAEIILHGDNTDCAGFKKSLLEINLPKGIKAMIFGNGGASAAAKFVLNQLEIPWVVLHRKNQPDCYPYTDSQKFMKEGYRLLINATPLGMFPDSESFPKIDYDSLGPDFICYDMVYNPEKTKFLSFAEKKGAFIINGMGMLQFQAEKAWELFRQNNRT